MASFILTVNGIEYQVEVASDTPLLWVLRDTLGLTGTKFSCGIGECGACTVHVDNEPVKSCIMPVSAVGEAQITTIEGLSQHGTHPVQEAWISERVPQCGYCQPGQIMAAAALLARNPNPTDEDIDAAMAGQLCRCGTYQRIRRAIHKVAEATTGYLADEDAPKIGSSPSFAFKSEGAGLLPLAGAMAFAGISSQANVSRRDFLRLSTVAGAGLIIGICLPGCKTAPTPTPSPSESASPAAAMPTSTATTGPVSTPLPTRGSTIAPTESPERATPIASPSPPTSTVSPSSTPSPLPPDPTATPPPTATPEPTVFFEPNVYLGVNNNGTVTITVHRSEMGQGVRTSLAMIVAEELEADWSKVRVVQAPADPVYGSQDTHGSLSIIECFEPLRRAGAAARMMLIDAAAQVWAVEQASCQAENGSVIHVPSGQRLSYAELVEIAATLPLPLMSEIVLKDPADFRIIGTSPSGVDSDRIVTGTAVFGIDGKLPNMLVATVARCPVFGGRVASFDPAPAQSVDGVRHVIQIDSGIAVVADNTWSAIRGREALQVTWDEGTNATLNTASVRQWFADQTATAESNSGSLYLEAVYGMPFLAHTTMSPMNCVAHVGDDFCEVWAPTQRPITARNRARSYAGPIPDSNLTVHVSLMGGGFGRRREADYVAEAVQISKAVGAPIKLTWTRDDDIQHDFYHPLSYQRIGTRIDTPGRQTAIASRTLQGIPTGAWRSADNLTPAFMRECFLDEIAAASGADPFELRLNLANYSQLKEVLEAAASRADWGSALPEGWGRGIAAHSTWGTSHVAEVVEVSVAQNGTVRVHRVVCALDCGMVIHPDNVAAQLEGGIVYGLTATLKGEITIENGRVQRSNFHDYPMLRIDEMPQVEVIIVPSSRSPQGVGEMSVPPVIPALLNAIFDATGKRIRRLPVDPEALRNA